jgi:hypothetical protein
VRRREVASRAIATMTAATRITRTAVSATSVRRETFGARVSADGIIRLVFCPLRRLIRYFASTSLSTAKQVVHRDATALD